MDCCLLALQLCLFFVVVMFFAGLFRLYYHVALTSTSCIIFNTLLCYIWISMDVVSEVISLLF